MNILFPIFLKHQKARYTSNSGLFLEVISLFPSYNFTDYKSNDCNDKDHKKNANTNSGFEYTFN